MGRIICKTHGQTGIILVCSHLTQNIQNAIAFKKVITASDKEFGEGVDLKYCTDCAVEYDLPMKDSELSEEKFDSMGEKNFFPNCYECFKELNN